MSPLFLAYLFLFFKNISTYFSHIKPFFNKKKIKNVFIQKIFMLKDFFVEILFYKANKKHIQN